MFSLELLKNTDLKKVGVFLFAFKKCFWYIRFMEKLSVYFHWPYCKSKCPYCDFFKKVDPKVNQEAVVESYINELEYYHALVPNRIIYSVFFGGGTPSLLAPKYIELLLKHISKLWSVEKNVEISLEANPNTNNQTLFADLKNAGINRLSLGVQALNEKDLKFLGRTHTLDEAYQSIEDVLKNFNNHSIDLIYARPEQKLKDWLIELEQAASFGLKHLSLYQLTIEENTVFFKRGVKALADEKAAEMYEKTVCYLREKGYGRYEVSNFAMKGFEAIHNKVYWQGGDYIGIGESAHGRLKIGGQHYALIHPHINEALSSTERAEELVIVGLRLEEGINKQNFFDISGVKLDSFINQKHLKQLIGEGLIVDTPKFLKATDKGFLLIDKIALELLS